MEGAFEAMAEGTVDENWAKQHHSLWLAEEKNKAPAGERAARHAGRIARSHQADETPGGNCRAFCYSGPESPDMTMRIIGLAGWSGSGKTTLVTKALPRLIARGCRVSTIKHAHHGFDLDQPGKDFFMHRTAGATEVVISSAKRFAILHELRDDPEWDLPDLLGKA